MSRPDADAPYAGISHATVDVVADKQAEPSRTLQRTTVMQWNKTKSRDTISLKKTAKMPRRVCTCTSAIASYLMIFIMLLQWQVIKADKNENTCTLYIAESSMEGVNGVGIFTAKPFEAGSTISPPDSPSIPVCDPWPNSGLVNHYWWGEGKGTSDEMSFECVDYTVSFCMLECIDSSVFIRRYSFEYCYR
jgi:hypothetical protein